MWNLGHPPYRRKARGDQSMAEKRGQTGIGQVQPRETRVTRSRLDYVRCGSSNQYLLLSSKAIG